MRPGVGLAKGRDVSLWRVVQAAGRKDRDVGLPEDHEQVALPGVLEVLGPVQGGVHAGLEYGDPPELGEVRGVGVVVEGARNQHDFLLTRDPRSPPVRVERLGGPGHFAAASRGISHSCQGFLRVAFSLSRSGSSVACHFSQVTSISALLAMDLSVMCGTRS
jgi:hypothetical protein